MCVESSTCAEGCKQKSFGGSCAVRFNFGGGKVAIMTVRRLRQDVKDSSQTVLLQTPWGRRRKHTSGKSLVGTNTRVLLGILWGKTRVGNLEGIFRLDCFMGRTHRLQKRTRSGNTTFRRILRRYEYLRILVSDLQTKADRKMHGR